jgi:hypothetical protein
MHNLYKEVCIESYFIIEIIEFIIDLFYKINGELHL